MAVFRILNWRAFWLTMPNRNWPNAAPDRALTTPVTSPQSNGRAEAFVRTIKRDDFSVNPRPDAGAAIEARPICFDPCNAIHPQGALR